MLLQNINVFKYIENTFQLHQYPNDFIYDPKKNTYKFTESKNKIMLMKQDIILPINSKMATIENNLFKLNINLLQINHDNLIKDKTE